MYIYMSSYVYTYTHTHTHANTHTHIHTKLLSHTQTQTYTHIHTRIHTHILTTGKRSCQWGVVRGVSHMCVCDYAYMGGCVYLFTNSTQKRAYISM